MTVRELVELAATVPADCDIGVLVLSPCGDVTVITAAYVAGIDATIADDVAVNGTGVGHRDTPLPSSRPGSVRPAPSRQCERT